MKHIVRNQNYILLVPKAHRDIDFNHRFISTEITKSICLSSKTDFNAIDFLRVPYPKSKDLITGIWIDADDQRIRFRDLEIGEASQTIKNPNFKPA